MSTARSETRVKVITGANGHETIDRVVAQCADSTFLLIVNLTNGPMEAQCASDLALNRNRARGRVRRMARDGGLIIMLVGMKNEIRDLAPDIRSACTITGSVPFQVRCTSLVWSSNGTGEIGGAARRRF